MGDNRVGNSQPGRILSALVLQAPSLADHRRVESSMSHGPDGACDPRRQARAKWQVESAFAHKHGLGRDHSREPYPSA